MDFKTFADDLLKSCKLNLESVVRYSGSPNEKNVDSGRNK